MKLDYRSPGFCPIKTDEKDLNQLLLKSIEVHAPPPFDSEINGASNNSSSPYMSIPALPEFVSDNFTQRDQYRLSSPLTRRQSADASSPNRAQQIPAHVKRNGKKKKVMVEVSIVAPRLMQDKHFKEEWDDMIPVPVVYLELLVIHHNSYMNE